MRIIHTSNFLAQAIVIVRYTIGCAQGHMSPLFQLPTGLAVKDKLVIGCGLVAVCGLAWTVMAWQAGAMMPVDGMGVEAVGMARPPPALIDFLLIYLMWVVMMVAMMVPGASPMIAVFAAIMGLLFAVAIMDLRWVAMITVLVTLEKLLPWPYLWRHLIGAIFMGAACVFAMGWVTL